VARSGAFGADSSQEPQRAATGTARGQSGQHERQRSHHTPRELEHVLDLLDNDALNPDFTVPGQTPVGTALTNSRARAMAQALTSAAR